jgi:hypothetical protein
MRRSQRERYEEVLNHLRDLNGRATTVQLAEKVYTTNQRITTVLNNMEKRGKVYREEGVGQKAVWILRGE